MAPTLPLVLASGSPRRADLLTLADVRFEVMPSQIPEERKPGEEPEAFVRRLATEKATAVANRVGATPPRLVLGADTIVVLGREVLGKPRDAEHAVEMLGRLTGREHTVVTGVALVASDTKAVHVTAVTSRVRLRAASQDELRAYAAGGEPLDKAGSYAVQGDGSRFVERIDGSETNVIGLPLEETFVLLSEAGFGRSESMSDDTGVVERLTGVREQIAAAARRAGRAPEEVTLIGVSKLHPAVAVAAAVRAGLSEIGENYMQEAVAKHAEVRRLLEGSDAKWPRWHFIGKLQSNKARDAAEHFDTVQTVDRESLGKALAKRAAQAERKIDVMLQVNTSAEPQKGGISPDALPGLLAASRAWESLRVVGLMTIPALDPNPEAGRPAYAALRELRDKLQREPGGEHLRELSMGMSGDFAVAIEEGATLVRVGTAIFGPRGG